MVVIYRSSGSHLNAVTDWLDDPLCFSNHAALPSRRRARAQESKSLRLNLYLPLSTALTCTGMQFCPHKFVFCHAFLNSRLQKSKQYTHGHTQKQTDTHTRTHRAADIIYTRRNETATATWAWMLWFVCVDSREPCTLIKLTGSHSHSKE